MAHTYCSSFYHCVFSTKGRSRIIVPETTGALWAYMGGIAREHKMKALGIGGVEDHALSMQAMCGAEFDRPYGTGSV